MRSLGLFLVWWEDAAAAFRADIERIRLGRQVSIGEAYISTEGDALVLVNSRDENDEVDVTIVPLCQIKRIAELEKKRPLIGKRLKKFLKGAKYEHTAKRTGG